MAKPKRMSTCEIMQVLEDNGVAQRLSYDYDTSCILKDGQAIEPKLEALHFIRIWNCNATVEDYQNAMYYWARQNSPKPNEIHDEVQDTICQYVADKEEVTTTEILNKCLKIPVAHSRRRRWEMKVARVMKELGWTKYRTSHKRSWIKEDLKLPDKLNDIL